MSNIQGKGEKGEQLKPLIPIFLLADKSGSMDAYDEYGDNFNGISWEDFE